MLTLASLLVWHGGFGWAQKAGEGRETARRLGPNRPLSSLYTGFLRKEEGTLDTSVIHWLMKYL